jgi:hypothetical protein
MGTKAVAAAGGDRWERHESRLVRPFRSAEDYLSDAKIRLYADSEFTDKPSIAAESIAKDNLNIAIDIAAAPAQLEDIVGAKKKELRLLVSVEDRLLKRSTVLFESRLSEFAGGVIELGEAAKESSSWAGETRIHAAVVLAENRSAQVGLAQRAGNWLAKKTFHVSRSVNRATFEIKPVDEDFFVKRGLPAGTTYLVDIQDADFNQKCDQVSNLVKVYLTKAVHSALARDEESPMAKALVRSIYVDVVSTILTTGFGNLNGQKIAPESVLEVVTSRLRKATGVSPDKLRQYAKDGGGPLRAVVQGEAALSRAMLLAAGRRGA